MSHTVLFVCTANICRSPMAMGLLKARVAEDEGDWRVESAGVWADYGYPAASNTIKVVRERGVRLEDHLSRPLTGEMLTEFNLILVMEKNHKEALRMAFPELAPRIYLLTEMVDRYEDIVDPIGGTQADFEETASEVEAILTQGFEKISRLSEDQDNSSL